MTESFKGCTADGFTAMSRRPALSTQQVSVCPETQGGAPLQCQTLVGREDFTVHKALSGISLALHHVLTPLTIT